MNYLSQLCPKKIKVMPKHVHINNYLNKIHEYDQESYISNKHIRKMILKGIVSAILILTSIVLVLAYNMPPIFFESILTGLGIIALITLIKIMSSQKTIVYTSKNNINNKS